MDTTRTTNPAHHCHSRIGRILRSFAIALAFLSGVAGNAAAQWRFDIEGGPAIPVSRIDLQGTGSTAVDTGGSYALGGGYHLGDWFETTAQFQQSFMGLFVLYGNSLDVYSLTAGGRIYLMPPQRFRPWIGTQIGWYRTDATASHFGGSVSRTDDSFGLNAGAGFDVMVAQRVSVGLDVKYHNAFDALDGFEMLSTMVNVGFHFGS